MIKLSKILVFGIIAVISVAVAVIFAIDWRDMEVKKTSLEIKKDALVDAQSQSRNITTYEDQPEEELKIQEVIDMIPSRLIAESEMQEWKSYTSEKLRISFKYPPNYIVVEVKELGTPTIGASVLLMVLEDTPHNRQYAKTRNTDFDYNIPEEQKNADIEAGQNISLSKSIEGGFTQNVVEWFGEHKSEKLFDRNVYAAADFIGIDALIYQAEGIVTADGVIFENRGYLYQFDVQYYNSPESPRDDFYKIISTVEFK